MNDRQTTGQKRPNVIWIFGDQHRGQATGYAGDPNAHTPNLDRLAADGVLFSGAVSGFPLCCPFRGSLMTSRYPHHCVPGHEYRMPADMPTIADAFNDAGYHTAYFGKWHLDGFKEREGRAAMHIIPPKRRGRFQQWVGYENNNSQWDSWVHGGEGDRAFHYRLPGYETDCLTDMLIDYLSEPGKRDAAGEGKPFFAVLSVQPPHDPYVAPRKFMRDYTVGAVALRQNVPPVDSVVERARRELAGYYAQIQNLDWNVGRVLDALDEVGLADDTYLVFFSDHGDMHGSHGQFRKTTPYQESIRIPFIICHARRRYGHRTGTRPNPVNHVDIAPTTLGLCGIDVPDWMGGTDHSGLYVSGRAEPAVPDSVFLQSTIPTGHGDSVDRPWRGVVTTDGWKYVCLEGQPWLMFNLSEDLFEQVNLAHNTRYRAERERLQERLAGWMNDTDDSFPLPEL